VYGSVDEQRFHPGLQRANVHQLWHVPASAPLIVCIAVMNRRKGLQVLLCAACQVIHTFPTATFLVVGHIHNRVYFQELQHDVARLGLTERVIFTGHRTDVAEILAAADVSVNASTEGEGLTGALREALAMQKPVVCTAICGNTEMVHDKESGWVVEPGNADALAAAIVEALSYPDEARRRAAKGYEWTLQHCTSNFRYHQTEHIYRALLQTPSSRF
jgi:glycosyltransferase involved in cell wall biosynthesis